MLRAQKMHIQHSKGVQSDKQQRRRKKPCGMVLERAKEKIILYFRHSRPQCTHAHFGQLWRVILCTFIRAYKWSALNYKN